MHADLRIYDNIIKLVHCDAYFVCFFNIVLLLQSQRLKQKILRVYCDAGLELLMVKLRQGTGSRYNDPMHIYNSSFLRDIPAYINRTFS